MLLVPKNVLLQVQDAQDLCSMGSRQVHLICYALSQCLVQASMSVYLTSPRGNAWPRTDNPANRLIRQPYSLSHICLTPAQHITAPWLLVNMSCGKKANAFWLQPLYEMPEGRAAALRRLKENRESSEQAASVDACLQAASEAGAASGVHAAMPKFRAL